MAELAHEDNSSPLLIFNRNDEHDPASLPADWYAGDPSDNLPRPTICQFRATPPSADRKFVKVPSGQTLASPPGWLVRVRHKHSNRD